MAVARVGTVTAPSHAAGRAILASFTALLVMTGVVLPSAISAGAAAAPVGAVAADRHEPVFACPLTHGSVSVTASRSELTLRLRSPGKPDTTVTGSGSQRTLFYRQDRYASVEAQLRFVSGRKSYIVYSMAGDGRSGSEPVSGLSVLFDHTVQVDLSCSGFAEFTSAPNGMSLPEDSEEYSAMRLP